MKYRIYSKKHKLYVDSPFYPNNQMSHSEFYLTPGGKVVEFISFDMQNYLKNEEINQKEFKILTGRERAESSSKV